MVASASGMNLKSMPPHSLVLIERGVALPRNWRGPCPDVTVLAEASTESAERFGQRVTARVARLVKLGSIADVRLFAAEIADAERLAARARMVRSLIFHAASSMCMTFFARRGERAQDDLLALVDALPRLEKVNVVLRLELREEPPSPIAAWT